jgi:hypothetical protein
VNEPAAAAVVGVDIAATGAAAARIGIGAAAAIEVIAIGDATKA